MGTKYSRRVKYEPVIKEPKDEALFGGEHCGEAFAPDEIEFMLAVERYKREKRRPFPAWSEILAVLKSLGYRKVSDEPGQPVSETERRVPDGS